MTEAVIETFKIATLGGYAAMAAQEVIDDPRYEELAHGLAAYELPVEDRPQQLGGGSRDIDVRFNLSADGGGAQDLAEKQRARLMQLSAQARELGITRGAFHDRDQGALHRIGGQLAAQSLEFVHQVRP